MLPALVAVLQRPPVRPVAPHLWSGGERAAMAATVHLLACHGLGIALAGPDATDPATGAPEACTALSPPVHRLVRFQARCPAALVARFGVCIAPREVRAAQPSSAPDFGMCTTLGREGLILLCTPNHACSQGMCGLARGVLGW